jgi:hypothetical protein
MKNSVQNLLIALVLFAFFLATSGYNDAKKGGVKLNFIDSLLRGFNIMLNREENSAKITNRLKTGELSANSRQFDNEKDPNFVNYIANTDGAFSGFNNVKKLTKSHFGFTRN